MTDSSEYKRIRAYLEIGKLYYPTFATRLYHARDLAPNIELTLRPKRWVTPEFESPLLYLGDKQYNPKISGKHTQLFCASWLYGTDIVCTKLTPELYHWVKVC
jgi:hypothetical protein